MRGHNICFHNEKRETIFFNTYLSICLNPKWGTDADKNNNMDTAVTAISSSMRQFLFEVLVPSLGTYITIL